jgi:hypothetical protein
MGMPSYQHQRALQLGQVVVPVLAGSCSVVGDRHGPQRQSARLRDHDGDLCERGSRLRAVDRRLRQTLPRRNIGGARAAVAGHAYCRKRSIGVVTRSAAAIRPIRTRNTYFANEHQNSTVSVSLTGWRAARCSRCNGQIEIGTAQEAIAKDWIAAYQKYYEHDAVK